MPAPSSQESELLLKAPWPAIARRAPTTLVISVGGRAQWIRSCSSTEESAAVTNGNISAVTWMFNAAVIRVDCKFVHILTIQRQPYPAANLPRFRRMAWSCINGGEHDRSMPTKPSSRTASREVSSARQATADG